MEVSAWILWYLEGEHPSETGSSCSCHARQWHTTPSPVSQWTAIQITLQWFCTWLFPYTSRCRNYAKVITDLPKQLLLSHPFPAVAKDSTCSIQKAGFLFGPSTGGSQGLNTCFHRKEMRKWMLAGHKSSFLKCLVDKNLAKVLPCIKNFISGKNMMG